MPPEPSSRNPDGNSSTSIPFNTLKSEVRNFLVHISTLSTFQLLVSVDVILGLPTSYQMTANMDALFLPLANALDATVDQIKVSIKHTFARDT